MKPILIMISILIFWGCLAKSSKPDSLAETFPIVNSGDSLATLLNEAIASELQFKILKNKIVLTGNTLEITRPIFDPKENRRGKNSTYILEKVIADSTHFSYNHSSNLLLLELTFPDKTMTVTIFNNGDFIPQNNRVKSISWTPPEHLIIYFRPILIDSIPRLRFENLKLVRHSNLERITDRYSNMCYNHIEGDLQEQIEKMFSSDQFDRALDHALDALPADFRHSTLFRNHINEP